MSPVRQLEMTLARGYPGVFGVTVRLMSDGGLRRLERRLGRPLAPRKPGPKPRVERDTTRQAQLL
jgi:hypothetical protein